MRKIIIEVDRDYSIDSIKDHLRNCGISCWGGKEINDNGDGDTLVSLDDVCKMLYSMLTTHMPDSLIDYDYVTAPAYDDVWILLRIFVKQWRSKIWN